MRSHSKNLQTLLLTTLLLGAACVSPNQSNSNQDPTMKTSASSHHHQPKPSPISLEELELIKQSMLFGEADTQALRMSLEVLKPHVDEILDVWYGFVGSTPQLLQYFSHSKTGEPDGRYLAEVRKRFAQWILDTAGGEYDQDWLNYQHEIGRRHHSLAKNKTDGVDSVPIIHFRYIPALAYPITTTLKPFLAKGGHSAEDVDRMHQAWIKSVLLQTILWSHPYVNTGEF